MNPINLKEQQTLSVVSVFISILSVLKQGWAIVFIPLITILQKGDDKKEKIATLLYFILGGVLIFAIFRISEISQYFVTRFYINDKEEFVLKKGLFNKILIIIPISKIQSFQANQNLINKISNTYKVSIETAGTQKTEAILLAISHSQMQALQSLLQQHQSFEPNISNDFKPNESNEQQFASTIKLTFKDFAKFCISENHLKTLAIITLFVAGKLNDFKDIIQFKTADILDKTIAKNAVQTNNTIVLCIAVLIITIFVSSLKLVLKYFDFSIKLNNQNIRMSWGLFSTQQKTIYYNKIQMFCWQSNLVRRLLKLSIIRVYAFGESETKHDTQISLPIAHNKHIDTILNHYQINNLFDQNDYLTIDKAYSLRYTILMGLPIFTIATIILYFKTTYLIVLPTIWLLYFFMSKKIFQLRFKLWINHDCIKIKKGMWGTEKIFLNWNNIQSVSLKTSPYQRANKLSNIVLHTAGKQVTIPYISLNKATFICDYAMMKIEKN